jgi:molybdopterin synthase catalytic subunit
MPRPTKLETSVGAGSIPDRPTSSSRPAPGALAKRPDTVIGVNDLPSPVGDGQPVPGRRPADTARPAGSGPPAGADRRGRVALTAVRDTSLSVDECLGAVRSAAVGGVVLFVGLVRDNDGDRSVAELEYTAHPLAPAELARVAAEVGADHPEVTLAVTHRVGDLRVGDTAVVVAAGARHRAEAFAACRRLIDDVKDQVPIWKRQTFTDSSSEWVGTP